MSNLKVIHTSDWHLGQNFMGKSRAEEHQAFLKWLLETIEKKSVNLLIVSGDIFDTATPPNYALELYYDFLTALAQTSCKNTIIIAGNHDSIATLKAPKQLLQSLNISVVTSGDKEENEVIQLFDAKHNLICIVCAVPFLRDYVVRESLSAQKLEDKENALNEGICNHYIEVYKEARDILKNVVFSSEVPLLATGHLTTVGSVISDSERDIYIGNMLHIDSAFLSSMFDYVALGHLHINQKLSQGNVFYSGSPIPLSFQENKVEKKVNFVTFQGKKPVVELLDIPQYRELQSFSGSLEEIIEALETIKNNETWIEIELIDENPFYANQVIREKAKDLNLTILALKISSKNYVLKKEDIDVISLEELEPIELFYKRLQQDVIEDEILKKELIDTFKKIVDEVKN